MPVLLTLTGLSNLDTPEDLELHRVAMVEDPEAYDDPLVVALRALSEQEQATALLLLSHFAGQLDVLPLADLLVLVEHLMRVMGSSARPLLRLAETLIHMSGGGQQLPEGQA